MHTVIYQEETPNKTSPGLEAIAAHDIPSKQLRQDVTFEGATAQY